MEENNQNNYGVPTGNVGSENQMFGVGSENQVYASAPEQPIDFIEGVQDVETAYINNSPVENQVQSEAPYVEPIQTENVMTQAPQVEEQAQAQAAPAPAGPSDAEIIAKLPPLDPNAQRIVLKTSTFNDALSKADIVAGKNELQPITEVVMLRVVKDESGKNKVQVRSTDKENLITVTIDTLDATDDLVVTLKLDKFKQLISKLKSDYVILIANGTTVDVIGEEGEYRFNQAVDLSTNEIIKVPDIDKDSILLSETVEVSKDEFYNPISQIYTMVKNMGADTTYAAVYLGNVIGVSNGNEVAIANVNLAQKLGNTALVKTSTINRLLSLGTGDKVNIGLGQINGTKTMCIYNGDEYRLYFVLKENEEDYPLDMLNNALQIPTGDVIQIKKAKLVDSLDRMCIFFNTSMSRKAIDLNKGSNGILNTSIEGTAKEKILATGTGNIDIKIDTARLRDILKPMESEEVILEPVLNGDGPVNFVKISSADRKIIQIVGAAL